MLVFCVNSAPAHVQEVSSGEWWCVRMKMVILPTAVRIAVGPTSNGPASRARVHSGSMATGER